MSAEATHIALTAMVLSAAVVVLVSLAILRWSAQVIGLSYGQLYDASLRVSFRASVS